MNLNIYKAIRKSKKLNKLDIYIITKFSLTSLTLQVAPIN